MALSKKNNARFVEIYSSNIAGENKILLDTVTGVQYFFHREGYGGGLTPLLSPDGRPIVTPPEVLFQQENK